MANGSEIIQDKDFQNKKYFFKEYFFICDSDKIIIIKLGDKKFFVLHFKELDYNHLLDSIAKGYFEKAIHFLPEKEKIEKFKSNFFHKIQFSI